MWLPDDWWGGDATGAYLGWSKPMTFNYSTQGTDRDTPAVETFNEMSVAVNSSQDVSFDFWTRGPPSNLPRFQAPNQPSAVSPDNTGVNPGGTDKDAGAASVDVSAISSPATITNTAPNTSARPLGMSHVAVDADKEIMVPFRTFKIEENTRVFQKFLRTTGQVQIQLPPLMPNWKLCVMLMSVLVMYRPVQCLLFINSHLSLTLSPTYA
jgi:hypothetical protein